MKRNSILTAAATAGLAGMLPAQTDLWTLRNEHPDNGFGEVVTLADINGDGVQDFAVGGPNDFINHSSEFGRAYVYSGLDRSLLFEFVGDGAGDGFGNSVADAGDVNGDGVTDIIIGALEYLDFTVTGKGYARIFSGADGSVLRTLAGTQDNAAFGADVSSAGDVDADGFADVLVGAHWGDAGGVQDVGTVHLFSGATGQELFSFSGTQHFDYCGAALAPLGDVNQDGYDDFIVGSFGERVSGTVRGAARVFSGRDFTILYHLKGSVDGGDLGLAVAGGGDLNADGIPDFVIGAPAEDSYFELGRVCIYSGATGALIRIHGGLTNGDLFGITLCCNADLDGDGVVDVAVGAPLTTKDGELVGAFYVFSGQNGALRFSEYGKNGGGGAYFGGAFGYPVAGIHDLNGDGKDELLVGATGDLESPGGSIGAIYLVTLADLQASWRNYGEGWSGTICEPTLVSDLAPALGTTITLALSNSRGSDTVALLLGGLGKATIPLNGSGSLLVAPPWIELVLPLPADGLELELDIDPDVTLIGLEFDVQALEVDPGASKKLSFTPGLELILGGS